MNTQEYKIKGWVARDQVGRDDFTDLTIGLHKPKRVGAEPYGFWGDFGEFMSLSQDMFPDLKWEDEPIEVELVIKKI